MTSGVTFCDSACLWGPFYFLGNLGEGYLIIIDLRFRVRPGGRRQEKDYLVDTLSTSCILLGCRGRLRIRDIMLNRFVSFLFLDILVFRSVCSFPGGLLCIHCVCNLYAGNCDREVTIYTRM